MDTTKAAMEAVIEKPERMVAGCSKSKRVTRNSADIGTKGTETEENEKRRRNPVGGPIYEGAALSLNLIPDDMLRREGGIVRQQRL